jgi:lipoate-protein ligase A
MKISGNAQRRTGKVVLFHGTILHCMGTALISRYLKHPTRQPDYRSNRPHGTFVRTIDAPPQAIKHVIADTWNAEPTHAEWPRERMPRMIAAILARSRDES